MDTRNEIEKSAVICMASFCARVESALQDVRVQLESSRSAPVENDKY